MDRVKGYDNPGGTFAEAEPLPADRTERRVFPRVLTFGLDEDKDDPALNDISVIQHGARAVTGKAVYSANGVNQATDQADAERLRKKRQADEDDDRELEHLAAWNREIVTVGGVEMTNEEAQDARQGVIDNADAYAKWAIKKGYLKPGQEDEFARIARRTKELEDRAGRGVITDAERAEREALRQSDVGRAVDQSTASFHQHHGVAARIAADPSDLAATKQPFTASETSLFLSDAPQGKAPRALPTEAFARPKLDPQVTASGLDL